MPTAATGCKTQMPVSPEQNPPTHDITPTAPLLCKLLINSNYDVHLQYKYLTLYREHVIPALGPYPEQSECGITATKWKSGMNRAGLPVEFNYNFSQAVVRVGVEPVGPFAGTDQNSFNASAIHDYLHNLNRALPGLDLRRFFHLAEDLLATEEEVRTILGSPKMLSAIGPWKTQTITAMDLQKSGEVLMKVYFYPQVKSRATGIAEEKLLFDAMYKADPEGRLSNQFSNMKGYLAIRNSNSTHSCSKLDGHGHNKDQTTSFFAYLLACDLVEPSKSRIKFYTAELQVDLDTVADVWTFGGRRTDPQTLAGLELLKLLWRLLPIREGFRPPPEGFSEIGKPAKETRIPLMFHFDMVEAHEFPEPQVYIPLFGEDDLAIVDGLTTFFRHVGWESMAEHYKSNFLSYYGETDLTGVAHICSWLSFSYKNGTPYISAYNHSFTKMWQANEADE
ncbi:brevianamide F prenyltransferase ftmB [Aspergillus tanneri]|uniref:Aromatic prenyltransferase (DMATS family) n=1 Tax=Aspergillus tanneri TaxID=1220188 RepID=A0A5M9NC45_9EURO|nr:aromatic prenyltransferase (DMATS family) [Aspergillus tanneri]KAA8652097.1 aromatic prenyltransferase (DMATS family) [Aspergillus tanneri]